MKNPVDIGGGCRVENELDHALVSTNGREEGFLGGAKTQKTNSAPDPNGDGVGGLVGCQLSKRSPKNGNEGESRGR